MCLLMTSRLSSAMELRSEAVLAMKPMQGITNSTGISLHIHTYIVSNIHTYMDVVVVKNLIFKADCYNVCTLSRPLVVG